MAKIKQWDWPEIHKKQLQDASLSQGIAINVKLFVLSFRKSLVGWAGLLFGNNGYTSCLIGQQL